MYYPTELSKPSRNKLALLAGIDIIVLELLIGGAIRHYIKYPYNELMPTVVFFMWVICLVQLGNCFKSIARWTLAIVDPDAWMFHDPIMLSREAMEQIYLKSYMPLNTGVLKFDNELQAYEAGKNRAEVQAARFFCKIILGVDYDEGEHRREESFLSFRRKRDLEDYPSQDPSSTDSQQS